MSNRDFAMTIKFRTESGSVYAVDDTTKVWASTSTSTRSDGGDFYERSPVIMGEPVTLVCPPFVEGAVARLIHTSPVVEIL